jgi:integrase
MFNVARKALVHLPGGVLSENPVSSVKFLDEHNIRDRVLTAEEFQRMLDASPGYLKPILQCAYYTGMRRGEILALTWDKVDLKAGFIRLKDTDTKTDEARSIPIGRELREVLGR